MRLLLKIKNSTPPVRKTALRQITDKAREFGAGPLFDKNSPFADGAHTGGPKSAIYSSKVIGRVPLQA